MCQDDDDDGLDDFVVFVLAEPGSLVCLPSELKPIISRDLTEFVTFACNLMLLQVQSVAAYTTEPVNGGLVGG